MKALGPRRTAEDLSRRSGPAIQSRGLCIWRAKIELSRRRAPVGKLTLLQPVRIGMVCRSKKLEIQQLRCVFAEDFILLLRGKIFPLSNAGHRMRVLGIEMRKVGGHQDMIFAYLL
jgi:hypothetical protein